MATKAKKRPHESTKNQSGMRDSEIVLPETRRNDKRRDEVEAYMRSNYGVSRRQARKATQKG